MVQLVILAGGLATRLRPITETIPKSLIEINGEPFIFHQLRLLKRKGISRVLICTGYLGSMIEELVGNGNLFGLTIDYSYDGDTLLGTGGAIRKALPLLDNEFMITYGDSYLDFDYQEMNIFFQNSGLPAVMAVYKNNNTLDKSNVIYQNEKLKLYSKKSISPLMNYVDYGISVVSKTIFDNREKDNIFDLSEIFEDLCAQRKLGAFEVKNRFYEVGSFSGINDLEEYIQINKL